MFNWLTRNLPSLGKHGGKAKTWGKTFLVNHRIRTKKIPLTMQMQPTRDRAADLRRCAAKKLLNRIFE